MWHVGMNIARGLLKVPGCAVIFTAIANVGCTSSGLPRQRDPDNSFRWTNADIDMITIVAPFGLTGGRFWTTMTMACR